MNIIANVGTKSVNSGSASDMPTLVTDVHLTWGTFELMSFEISWQTQYLIPNPILIVCFLWIIGSEFMKSTKELEIAIQDSNSNF